jgi:hypothetical protein
MICLHCHADKPPDAFHVDRSRPTGRMTHCAQCERARMAKRRAARHAYMAQLRAQGPAKRLPRQSPYRSDCSRYKPPAAPEQPN